MNYNTSPKTRKIRLFTNNTLAPESLIEMKDSNYNYLVNVMRVKVGDNILVFNGEQGEWRAEVIVIEKKICILRATEQVRKQYNPPALTLAFAPIKRIEVIAEKGTELGVTDFLPVITERTVVNKVNADRFRANIKEAAEQSERTDMPTIKEPVKLAKLLKGLDKDTIVILCDESGDGIKASEALSELKNSGKKIMVLIGPEGGFSEAEFNMIKETANTVSIGLGTRILRADTAVVVALALVQEVVGDF